MQCDRAADGEDAPCIGLNTANNGCISARHCSRRIKHRDRQTDGCAVSAKGRRGRYECDDLMRVLDGEATVHQRDTQSHRIPSRSQHDGLREQHQVAIGGDAARGEIAPAATIRFSHSRVGLMPT